MDDIAGRKALLEASGLTKGRVLDIGMGDCGCMSFYLARRGFQVVGIDSSSKAVHEARETAARRKCSGLFSAKRANAEQLPFERCEFDAVIAYNSFHHMNGVGKAISEMFRVCKDKGLVIISDLHDNEPGSGELLQKIERLAAGRAKNVRTIRTKHNTVFMCRK
ncbi:MAG: class I SAM-dependent methyltransferase [Nitrospiraceae bacterium]|nr:class I SAM-dependent methyltransferase [Nitrospiraceae bacterium]